MTVPTWTLDIETSDAPPTPVESDVPFKTAKFSWSIDGHGSCEIELLPSQMSSIWRPGLHRVHANASSGPGFSGYLNLLDRGGDPGPAAASDAASNYRASGQGLRSILDWRVIRHPFTIVDTLDNIVENVLDELQVSQTANGDMGFQMGTVTGSFPSRRRTFCRGQVAFDCIDELSGIGDGFDWEIDEDGNLNLWAPSRGIDSGETLAETDVHDWAISSDATELVTTVTAQGDSNRPWGPISRKFYNMLANDYGRHEVAIDVDSNDIDDLSEAAHAILKTQGGQIVRTKVMWIDDRGPWDWGDVWLDDLVSVANGDYFGGTQNMRCLEVTATLEPGVHMYSEYTFEALVHDITEDTSEGDNEVEDSES